MSTDPREIEIRAVARAAFLASRAGRKRRLGPVWIPQAGPQEQAYNSPADEIYYGGAAGGGKTDLELGVGFTQAQRTFIFRREYTQLREIVERGREILQDAKAYNENTRTFTTPDGRKVELGAMEYENDKYNYKGRPKDCYCFDEAPDFTETQFLFVINWLRTTRPHQRLRIILAGNPPLTPEGYWIVRRYAPWLDRTHPLFGKVAPGELLYFARLGDEDVLRPNGEPFEYEGEIIKPQSRTFIPARLSDNAYVTPEYRQKLLAAPEPLRSQLLYGSFEAGRKDDPWQVIPSAWVEQAVERWRSLDYAAVERGENYRPSTPLTAIGVDVARGGADQTVIAKRFDNWFAPLIRYKGSETKDGPAVAAKVLEALEGSKAPVNIDAIGVGTSPLDILRANSLEVNAVNFSEGTDERDKSGRYKLRNMRSLAYWRMREALDPENGAQLALPPDPDLQAELCAPRWGLTASGILIESKDEIRKRLGRSTDAADAVVMAHMDFAAPIGVFV